MYNVMKETLSIVPNAVYRWWGAVVKKVRQGKLPGGGVAKARVLKKWWNWARGREERTFQQNSMHKQIESTANWVGLVCREEARGGHGEIAWAEEERIWYLERPSFTLTLMENFWRIVNKKMIWSDLSFMMFIEARFGLKGRSDPRVKRPVREPI